MLRRLCLMTAPAVLAACASFASSASPTTTSSDEAGSDASDASHVSVDAAREASGYADAQIERDAASATTAVLNDDFERAPDAPFLGPWTLEKGTSTGIDNTNAFAGYSLRIVVPAVQTAVGLVKEVSGSFAKLRVSFALRVDVKPLRQIHLTEVAFASTSTVVLSFNNSGAMLLVVAGPSYYEDRVVTGFLPGTWQPYVMDIYGGGADQRVELSIDGNAAQTLPVPVINLSSLGRWFLGASYAAASQASTGLQFDDVALKVTQ